MPRYKFEKIAFNSTEKKKPVEADKETYLGLEHLDTGCLKVSRWGAEVAPIGDKLVMRKGDVLFGRRRAYQKKVAIAPFDGIFSAHGMVLRPNLEVVTERFFPFFISSDYFLDAAIKISVGSLSPTINWRDLKELEFNLPPIEKQDVLADELWAFEETKEAYSGLMSATDALVKSQFIEMFGDPVTNPKGWRKETLEQNAVLLNGRAYKQDELLDSGKWPVLRVGNFFSNRGWYYSDLDLDEDKYCDNGDLLFAWSASFGPRIWNGGKVIYHYHIWKVLVGGEYNKDFLCNLLELSTASLMEDTHGIAMMHLTKSGVEKSLFIVPPLDLQEKYIAFVESINKSKFALQQNIERLEMCRNALMQKAFG